MMCNVPPFLDIPNIPSIDLPNLEVHVKALIRQPEKLDDEFKMVRECDEDKPHTAAMLPSNYDKNRYSNILPFDETRVRLSKPSKKHSDFINANYICGYTFKKEYIATQGPLPQTIDDFWRMIWDTNSHVIVMVTNPVEGENVKCEVYWPDEGIAKKYGHISVACVEEVVKSTVTLRRFELSISQKNKEIMTHLCTQFHYTAWPDMGVPSDVTSILKFTKLVRNAVNESKGPIVVHCSAGVGRTGTLIAIDVLLQKLTSHKSISVQKLVIEMRAQRPTMVQTPAQYMFIYNAVLHQYLYGETEVTRDTIRDHYDNLLDAFEDTEESRMEKEYEGACSIVVPDETMVETATDNPKKNRPGIALPLDINRVCLNDPDESGDDYINASFIACIGRRAEYILTQHPLDNTVEDFWQMVLEKHITVIVLIGPVEKQHDIYWPTTGEVNYDAMLVTLMDSDESDGVNVMSFEVFGEVSDVTQTVTLFHLLDWPTAEGEVPTSTTSFLSFVKLVQEHSESMLSVVHTSSSLPEDVSGVYCVVNSLYKQLKENNRIDVMACVKRTLQQRQKCISSKDQYQFIYECLVASLEDKLL